MLNQAKNVLDWYDKMQNPVPTWYFKGYYLQYINGLPYKLKSHFDFGFLSRYGKIFKIFDYQDSGNICFGAEKNGERYFIKFAGAPTEKYTGKPEDAIARLKSSVPVYQELRHPNLIEFVKAEEVGGGFAMVFRWVNGECMARIYPESHRKFMETTMETRLKVFNDILSFFRYVASRNYVAIDFYDGSILYDFEKQETIVCDIDFFRKTPCTNDMGRMWGSSRFQSPEEYQLGAVIDEVTNVYTMGATAFALFSDCNRSRESWPLNDKAYEIASKAVSDDRQHRQQSIEKFIGEWEAAK
jgi:serine/threonine-protein kinase